jgi:hypothetical protein
VTLSKELPFTLVDHARRHGDGLVGLNFKQIEAFHGSPPGQAGDLPGRSDQVVKARGWHLRMLRPLPQGQSECLVNVTLLVASDRTNLLAASASTPKH